MPGMDGTGLMFEPLLKALPPWLASVTVTYPPREPMTYRELLPLVLGALPERDPFILVGESFSGPLALMAAATRPAGLRAVVLVSTFLRNPIPWLPKAARHLARPPLFRLAPPFIRLMALASSRAAPDLRLLMPLAYGQVSPQVMALRARQILEVDVAGELARCGVPVYLLGGEQDRLTPRSNLRAILRLRPEVKTHLLPGPHLILQARPRESAGILTEIVNAVSAADAPGDPGSTSGSSPRPDQ